MRYSTAQAKEALEDPPVVDDGPGMANGIGGGYDGDSDGSGDGGDNFSTAEVSEATPAAATEAAATAGGSTGGVDGNADRLTGAADAGEVPSYAEARRLFELGILADPAHGPLYNAYG